MPKISIVVPAYNRAKFLGELLESILAQSRLPSEVVICEDCSAERIQIRDVCNMFRQGFDKASIAFLHVENQVNLGYDGNLRQCLLSASGEYVIFMGNDDVMLPTAVEDVASEIDASRPLFVSRAFVSFYTTPLSPDGSTFYPVSRDANFNSNIGLLFRISSVISGLVFCREPAVSWATSKYDGTLFYQYYLAMRATENGKIAYISKPTVACRRGIAPDFGGASTERGFTPGGYTPLARFKMATGTLRIAQDCSSGAIMSLVREINSQQSFHIFEMMCLNSREASRATLKLFWGGGLFRHPVPLAFALINLLLGRYAWFFYRSVRNYQSFRNRSRLHGI